MEGIPDPLLAARRAPEDLKDGVAAPWGPAEVRAGGGDGLGLGDACIMRKIWRWTIGRLQSGSGLNLAHVVNWEWETVSRVPSDTPLQNRPLPPNSKNLKWEKSI